jgi:phosphoribosylformimino-5-aminoimidazole carboxamide ribotide isomerase
LTSIDKDGTNKGPDFELCKFVRSLTDIPLIYSGGISSKEDINQLFNIGLDGCAIASALHSDKLFIDEVKEFLGSKAITVRV